MKTLGAFLLGIVLLSGPATLPAQTADGARPAATTFPRFGLSRLRCAIFNKRRLTVTRGTRQEFNFPDAIAGFSKDPSMVHASLEFGTLTVEGVAVGKTQIIIVGALQEKRVIQVQVVDSPRVARGTPENRNSTPPPPAMAARVAPAITPAVSAADSVPSEHAALTASSNTRTQSATLTPPPAIPQPPPSNGSVPGRNQPPAENSVTPPLVAAPLDDTVKLVELTAVEVPQDQVTAAYSLDPLTAEAQIDGDHVRIWGRAPGHAVIVLVHKDFSTTTLNVAVMQAPPILPDGVWSGLNAADASGYYEGRVSSSPTQIGQLLDYRAGRMHLHLANAIVPEANLPGVSTTWFPFSYFRFDADHWRLTLLDERVDSSPISVRSTVLRGIHFGAGGLSIHAGYTSVAGFQSLFLPVHKQLIAGATYVRPLSSKYDVGVTAYYIERDAFAFDPQAASSVATLFFRKHSLHGLSFSAEAGVSKGIGGALSADRITTTDQFRMSARYRPRHYAAPDIDNLAGLQSQARWNHRWSRRFTSDASGSATHLFTRAGAQITEVGSTNLRFKPSRRIVLSSGFTAASFSDRRALFPDVHRISFPVSLSYDRLHFGLGAQYEYSKTSRAFAPGQAYRGSLRLSGGHFQLNANAGLDTQALGIDSVFSSFPGLNVELASLGFGTTTSPEQLAALLQDRAFLNSLGIAPGATLQLVPRNWHGGLDMSWRSARQSVEFDSSYNMNSFLLQTNTTVLQTLRYRRGLSRTTEVVASFTMFETIAPTHSATPIWEIGVRHQFGGNPFSRFHQRDGNIAGTVRLQDNSGTKLVRGAEITLDGDRKTNSDNTGHYQFSRVRAGVHSVQIAFKSDRPFYYTSPSKVSTMSDSVVDFGVIYPSAQLVGYALSDAGVGLPAIGIMVKGPQGERTLTTDKTGQFFVPVAQPGDYVLTVNAETVPDGYALEDLAPAGISVAEGEFKKVSFKLPAIRALTGVVQGYDPARASYVPLENVTVELAELNEKTITDSHGAYSFRNMPAGTLTIRVDGKPVAQVSFGVGPQVLRQNIRLGSGATIASSR